MISTTSVSEMIVKPERIRRRTIIQNEKSFTDISFKDDPDPYGLSIPNEEPKEGKDRFMHCVKSVRNRIFSGLYFPAFKLNTENEKNEKKTLHGKGQTFFPLTVKLFFFSRM